MSHCHRFIQSVLLNTVNWIYGSCFVTASCRRPNSCCMIRFLNEISNPNIIWYYMKWQNWKGIGKKKWYIEIRCIQIAKTGPSESLKLVQLIINAQPHTSCLHLKIQQILQVIYITATGDSKSIIRNINANIIYPEWDRDDTVVKVLSYKLEDHWFDYRWCHWNFSLT